MVTRVSVYPRQFFFVRVRQINCLSKWISHHKKYWHECDINSSYKREKSRKFAALYILGFFISTHCECASINFSFPVYLGFCLSEVVLVHITSDNWDFAVFRFSLRWSSYSFLLGLFHLYTSFYTYLLITAILCISTGILVSNI